MFETQECNRVFRIIISRDGHRNSIRVGDWAILERAVRAANSSEAAVVVLESADPMDFCAGSDLHDLESLRSDESLRKRFRGAIESACTRLRNVNKPTICVIDGGCFGTAVSLATACDLRIASPRSTFAITPALFGISYPKGPLKDLVSLVGRGQAARLTFGADRINAAEANRIGLIEIIGDRDTADAVIGRIAGNSLTSLCSLKASLLDRFGVDQRFDDAFHKPDFKHGMESFRTKQAPQFRAG